MTKTEILNKINSSVYNINKVKENLYHGKVFVTIQYDRIEGSFKTKRGAEGHVKRQSHVSYYDEYTMEMVNCGSGIEIVEIKETEIIGFDNVELWYNETLSCMTPYLCDYASLEWNVKNYCPFEDLKNTILGYIEVWKTGKLSCDGLETMKKIAGIKEEVKPLEIKEEVKEVAANTEYEITQDVHTKTGETVYIVKLVNRVSKEEFKTILAEMKLKGAYYSKFKNGFLFKEDPTTLLIPEVEEVEEIAQSETVENNIVSGEVATTETTQKPELIDNTKLVIFIEGEGSTPELTTNSIAAATENLNARILNEYNHDGGYSKTWITLTYKDNSYKFRYDIDNKMNLQSNIIEFMINEETQELNYTLENREKFSSYMNIESYEQEKKEIISILNKILKDNSQVIEIKENPYIEAVNQIQENSLYILKPSHDWLLKDNRLIRNDAFNAVTIATGKAVKEFITEGKGISPFNLKTYTGNLISFKDGLRKCDTGAIFSLFPTKEDIELTKIKMLDRLENELKRIA